MAEARAAEQEFLREARRRAPPVRMPGALKVMEVTPHLRSHEEVLEAFSAAAGG